MIQGKEVIALRKRMDRHFTGLIYNGIKIKHSADSSGDHWLCDGIASAVYDEEEIIFDKNRFEELTALNGFVDVGQEVNDLPNARLEYLKPCGTCLAAQLKDESGRRLMINNAYYHLFGNKFDFKLYVPNNESELQAPAVFVYYLDDLVGIILPVKNRQEQEQ